MEGRRKKKKYKKEEENNNGNRKMAMVLKWTFYHSGFMRN